MCVGVCGGTNLPDLRVERTDLVEAVVCSSVWRRVAECSSGMFASQCARTDVCCCVGVRGSGILADQGGTGTFDSGASP